jgi:hypothetical protein
LLELDGTYRNEYERFKGKWDELSDKFHDEVMGEICDEVVGVSHDEL